MKGPVSTQATLSDGTVIDITFPNIPWRSQQELDEWISELIANIEASRSLPDKS